MRSSCRCYFLRLHFPFRRVLLSTLGTPMYLQRHLPWLPINAFPTIVCADDGAGMSDAGCCMLG